MRRAGGGRPPERVGSARLEAFHGAESSDAPFVPGRPISGFRTGTLGMGHVVLHVKSVEDARWFSRADLVSNGALLPPRQSISFRLIEHWFDAGGGARLRDIHGSSPWIQSR